MAGYGDSRNYVGTLGVSYSLKAVLQAVEEVRFVIVIQEASLSNDELSKTVEHFVSMFNFGNIDKNLM